MPPIVSSLALPSQPLAVLLKSGAWLWSQRDVLLLLTIAFSPVLLASLLSDYGAGRRPSRSGRLPTCVIPPPASETPELFPPVSLFDGLRFY